MSTDVIKTIFFLFNLWKREVSPHIRNRQTTNQLTNQNKKSQRKTNKLKAKKTEKTSFSLPHAFIEDTIRQKFAQMTFTSKVYIPCYHI